MRVLGIVVVDGGPLDLATQVLLKLAHQALHVDFEVELRTVFG